MFQVYYTATAPIILKWSNFLDWMMVNKTQLPYNQLFLLVSRIWIIQILFLDTKIPLLM